MNRLFRLGLPLALVACGGPGDDSAVDESAPLLVVETPARGTVTGDSTALVSGTVSDDSGTVAVTINGAVAEVIDGRFEASVATPPGMTLIETVATDEAGNHSDDVRALLAGRLADQGTPVDNAVVAAINDDALRVLSGMVADAAADADLTEVAKGLNPVVVVGGGCFRAEVDVIGVSYGKLDSTVVPRVAGLSATAVVSDLVVDMVTRYKVACIPGGGSITLSADALEVQGELAVALTDGGDLDIALDDTKGTFVGFNLALSGVPNAIVNLFEGSIGKKVAAMLVAPLTSEVPRMAKQFFSSFVRDSVQVAALGQSVDLKVVPTSLELSPEGGFVAMQVTAEVAGTAGGSFLISPSPMPALSAMNGGGLQMAVADDLANQLLAGFWAANALDQSMPSEAGSPSAAFGSEVDHIDVEFSLPPVIKADRESGVVTLTLGDLFVSAIDDNDGLGTVAEFVISAEIELTMTTNKEGRLRISTAAPVIHAKLLKTSDTVAFPLTDDVVAAMAEKIIDQSANTVEALLETLPLPTFGGVKVSKPIVGPGDGYLLVGADID